MKKLLHILILLSITLQVSAQIDSCGTPDADSAVVANFPWFGNNSYLTNLRDSLHNANNCNNCRNGYEGGIGNYIYQIPVRVILYYDATHRAFNDDEVQWYINAVNRIYWQNGLRVHLYLDCSIYRENNSTKAYAGNFTQLWATAMSTDRHSGKLNIHLVHGWNTGNGIGPYPWLQNQYGCAVIANGVNPFNDPNGDRNVIAGSIAHEVAHTLGLLHTFHRNHCRNDCFQECVSRTRTQESKCLLTIGKLKCSVNGDCLCDTDADPSNLSGVSWGCNYYTITNQSQASNACAITDNYGDYWLQAPRDNALRNLMTYTWCQDNQLTSMQQGVMYDYIRKEVNSFKYNADVDFYENDNFYQTSPFALNSNTNIFTPNATKRYHAFHLNSVANVACDIDWVYFQNSTSTAKPYVIQTQEVTGKPKPDTKITLYSINTDGTLGAQLATNDDISGTNLFSKITTSNLAANSKFALKIENKVTNVADTRSKGHYYLRIDACYDKTDVAIVGDNTICTSKQYSISNLPVGATVTWQGSSCVSISTTNNVATVTKTCDNTMTLTATISYCGETYVVTKENIKVGLPYLLYSNTGCTYPEALVETDFEEGPCNSQCYSPSQSKWWCATPVYNATNVTWQKVLSVPANYNFWSGNWSGNNNFVNILFKSANQYVELKTTMSNTCGSIEQYYCFNSTTTLCPAPMMMMAGGNQTLKVYPNPTSAGNIVSLELYLEEEPIDFENSTIQLLDSKNKIILEKTGKKVTKEQLEIPTISSGTYYISITNVNGTVSEELIINGSR